MLKNWIDWQTQAGDEMTVGDLVVRPYSQAITVRWPNGGWVWNRPVAVEVKQNGQTWRQPIVDVTRIAQVTLYGLSAVFVVLSLGWWLGCKTSRPDRSG